jgi:predicted flap endonuclease-1-like 5' DNA nuclease
MPELNVIHITIIAALTVVGAIVGWVFRGQRAGEEKAVVNKGWQEQINAQRTEHDRLTEQNKALMEQISQYLASNKDAKNRAKELSEAVQEANERRDQLQREIKDIRSTLEVSLNERDQLQSDISSQAVESQGAEAKDARIKKLQLSLESWQDRLPPLIQKFQQRNEEANQLESDRAEARKRIIELESSRDSDQTRIESVHDPEELTDGRDASNDAIDDGVDDDGEEDEDLVAPEDVLEPDDTQYVVDVVEDDEEEEDEGDDDQDDDSIASINDDRDDLKAIKGIGPAIEKTLNELGIFRYQQIADMSEYDIDRVAKHLKGFRSRIYREDWTGQARGLGDQDPSD